LNRVDGGAPGRRDKDPWSLFGVEALFFLRGWCVVFCWCFCGVVVVFCVVDVVFKQSSFVVMKDVTRIVSLFFGFPVLEKIPGHSGILKS
jgi:hypothetical protein